MKFFEKHFTLHHLRQAPHKWFLALVLSPIHHAEMRYKKTYHLRFVHAKKLFFLDSILLLSTIVLLGATLVWWLYDPTVTELVHLDITAQTEVDRLRSGDDVLLTVTYHNESDVTLLNPAFHMTLPPGYILSAVSLPYTLQNNGTLLIPVDSVGSGDEASFTLSGRYYAPLGDHTPVQALLVYTQEGRTTPESDVDRLLLTARDPSVTIELQSPQQVIPQTNTPVSLVITNMHDHELLPIRINTVSAGITWRGIASSTVGDFSPQTGSWDIPALPPGAQATLTGSVQFTPEKNSTSIDWIISSTLITPLGEFVEYSQSTSRDIARPSVEVGTSWSSNFTLLGDTPLLVVRIKNNGNTPLERVTVVYGGKTYRADQETIQPGETIPLSVSLPVRSDSIEQASEGPLFIPSLLFSSHVTGIPEAVYTSSFRTEPLRVGTSLSMSQGARYYTIEGDQLGRGPLPPQVGKETKYWVFVQIKNTVGTLENITYTTTLAPGVTWTGKSSVSRGGDITYTSGSRTASWQAYTVNPYETIGIYYELAVSPDVTDIGSIPSLITQSSVSASDPYTERRLNQTLGALNASLSGDAIGREKGVIVR